MVLRRSAPDPLGVGRHAASPWMDPPGRHRTHDLRCVRRGLPLRHQRPPAERSRPADLDVGRRDPRGAPQPHRVPGRGRRCPLRGARLHPGHRVGDHGGQRARAPQQAGGRHRAGGRLAVGPRHRRRDLERVARADDGLRGGRPAPHVRRLGHARAPARPRRRAGQPPLRGRDRRDVRGRLSSGAAERGATAAAGARPVPAQRPPTHDRRDGRPHARRSRLGAAGRPPSAGRDRVRQRTPPLHLRPPRRADPGHRCCVDLPDAHRFTDHRAGQRPRDRPDGPADRLDPGTGDHRPAPDPRPTLHPR